MSYPATATASNMPTPGGPGGFAGAPPMAGGPPGSGPGGAPPPGGKDDSYFTESRKGEVNELRQLLRTFGTERDKQRKRDIMKKVIAYMTLGIDVSRLFTEMMLAIETRDLVIKVRCGLRSVDGGRVVARRPSPVASSAPCRTACS